ncbi:MAG: PEGA domain-containing protein [Patescibacteria group bacterium]|nr:PEGA domain-containing protein [Patescibacteria group bacterium]
MGNWNDNKMNLHLKKLTYRAYLISAVIVLAIVFGVWILSNSFVSVKVSPREASVFVDGEPVSVNSFGFAKERLSLGSHLVKVELDGYVSSIKTITLKRGTTNSQYVVLKQNPPITEVAKNGQFLTAGNNSNEFFYLGNDGGTIYKTEVGLNDSGKILTSTDAVTNSNLFGIEEIIWSPKKDLALFRKSDGIYIFDFKKYDFVSQTETLWGENIGSIAWSPDNSKIAYYSPVEKTLIFSNLDNSSKQRIINLGNEGITDPRLFWSPDSEWLLLVPNNASKSSNKIYLLDAYSKTIKELTTTGNKTDAVFSPNSDKVFYLTQGRAINDTTVSTINKDGTNDSTLGFSAEMKGIFFLEGDDTLVAAKDGESQEESIFKFDLKNNRQKDFSIKLPENNPVDMLLTANDNGVAVFETESGIYAMKIINR